MVPGKFVYETFALSHEKLSVLRKWCLANNYRLDESRLYKEPKNEYEEFEDEWNN